MIAHGRLRRVLALLAVALLASALVAPLALALTPMSVTYGAVPDGWEVTPRAPTD